MNPVIFPRTLGMGPMGHDNQLATAQGKRLLTALRKVCADLPESTEVVDGFGHTTFQVGRKSFVIAGAGENGPSISIKADRVSQGVLIARGPYYRTPYIGQHGWVSVDRPLEQNWKEIQELIGDAYRLAAPRRLAATAAAPPPPARRRRQR